MRLINVKTEKLEDFYGDEIPPYAILSHAWEEDEVTFDDWQKVQEGGGGYIKRKKGYSKIANACRFTKNLRPVWRNSRKVRPKYLWVDTACIDKKSSAELSEAINSMFDWYKNSTICLIYMADVDDPGPRPKISTKNGNKSDSPELWDKVRRQFMASRWFTRGWTLQELLAPRKRLYLSVTWSIIGNQNDLLEYISEASEIPRDVLQHRLSLASIPVAERMFWASKRKTTRPEDTAYCLMGIFGVNIPLIYGEGFKAFRRLQLEIIKEVHDHSLFLWGGEGRPSILAPSPQSFNCSFSGSLNFLTGVGKNPYYATNVGLLMNLPMIPTADEEVFLAVLDYGPFLAEDSPLLQYCLIVIKAYPDGNAAYDDVKTAVLGYLVVNLTSPHGREFSALEFFKQKLHLPLTASGAASRASENEVKAAEGMPFMLLYSWALARCSVMRVLFPEDKGRDLADNADDWRLDEVRSWHGILRLEKSLHPSGLQILLLTIVTEKTHEHFTFFVVHHPSLGWNVHWYGTAWPDIASRTATAQKILDNWSTRAPEKEIKGEPNGCQILVQSPVWPGKLEQLNHSKCVLITLRVYPSRYGI